MAAVLPLPITKQWLATVCQQPTRRAVQLIVRLHYWVGLKWLLGTPLHGSAVEGIGIGQWPQAGHFPTLPTLTVPERLDQAPLSADMGEGPQASSLDASLHFTVSSRLGHGIRGNALFSTGHTL